MSPRIPNPTGDADVVRCGHDFLINRCPYEKCLARELCEALASTPCVDCMTWYGWAGDRAYPECGCLPQRTLLARVREEEVAPGPESAE